MQEIATKIKYEKGSGCLAHYTARITRNKPVSKLKEKDWKEIEKEALEEIFRLIKTHVNIHEVSDEGARHAVIEYDVIVETPKLYRHKENLQPLEFKHI